MSLHGMEAFKRALERTPGMVKNRLAGAVASSTFAVAQGMRAYVPRRTGLLASNITSRVSGLNGSITIGVDAYYWQFVEYGTKTAAAVPFIRNAFEQEGPVFARRIELIAQSLERDLSAMAA